MNAGLRNLIKLNRQGLVGPHNSGATPALVIDLFGTKPEVWHAELVPNNQLETTRYTIRSIKAMEGKGQTVLQSDIHKAIKILADYFDVADGVKVGAGHGYRVRFPRKPTMILLWWD